MKKTLIDRTANCYYFHCNIIYFFHFCAALTYKQNIVMNNINLHSYFEELIWFKIYFIIRNMKKVLFKDCFLDIVSTLYFNWIKLPTFVLFRFFKITNNFSFRVWIYLKVFSFPEIEFLERFKYWCKGAARKG